MPRRLPLTPEQVSEAARLCAAGDVSFAEIASRFGVSPLTLKKALRRNGHPQPAPKLLPDPYTINPPYRSNGRSPAQYRVFDFIMGEVRAGREFPNYRHIAGEMGWPNNGRVLPILLGLAKQGKLTRHLIEGRQRRWAYTLSPSVLAELQPPDKPDVPVVPAAPVIPARRAKYGAIRTEVDGHKFPSKREASRYVDLRGLLRLGMISELRLQPRYPITVNGTKICAYVADFEYRNTDGALVTEDAKGVRTQVYKLKSKLFAALYGRQIVEV